MFNNLGGGADIPVSTQAQNRSRMLRGIMRYRSHNISTNHDRSVRVLQSKFIGIRHTVCSAAELQKNWFNNEKSVSPGYRGLNIKTVNMLNGEPTRPTDIWEYCLYDYTTGINKVNVIFFIGEGRHLHTWTSNWYVEFACFHLNRGSEWAEVHSSLWAPSYYRWQVGLSLRSDDTVLSTFELVPSPLIWSY